MGLTTAGAAACAKCRFFDAEAKDGEPGLCRYNPPVGGSGDTAPWPTVEASDWCGHFEPAAA